MENSQICKTEFPESYLTSATPTPEEETAVAKELETLLPIWKLHFQEREEDEAVVEAKSNAEIAVAKEKIAQRWRKEKIFHLYLQSAKQLLSQLKKSLDRLRAKEKTDDSAEKEARLTKRLIQKWENSLNNRLEDSYSRASEAWFKPSADPLAEDYFNFVEEVDSIVADFEWEISLRPEIEKKIFPKAHEESNTTFTLLQPKGSIVQFTTKGLISKFKGEPDDENVFFQFSNWKTSWDNLVKDMREMPGFTEAILFQKLKECLDGPALSLVSVFATSSPSAYTEAMNCLTESYEDPIKLANFYLKKATDPNQEEATMAESILKSSQALKALKDVLIEQGVDMYEFALMHAFLGSMPPNMKADWEGHKYKAKQDHLHSYERSLKSDQPMMEWSAGRVENLDSFNTWLRLYKARIPNVIPAKTVQRTSSTSSDKNVNICALCSNSHFITKCPKALGMSYADFRDLCVSRGICFRCLKTYKKDHPCNTRCKWCQQDRYHSPLLCPNNKFRTKPLDIKPKDNISRKRTNKNSSSNDFTKIAKIMSDQITSSITSAMNPQTMKSGGKKPNKN